MKWQNLQLWDEMSEDEPGKGEKLGVWGRVKGERGYWSQKREDKWMEEDEWETMMELLLKDKDGQRDNDGGEWGRRQDEREPSALSLSEARLDEMHRCSYVVMRVQVLLKH